MADSYPIDSNILLRISRRGDSDYRMVDGALERLLREAYTRAHTLLQANIKGLHRLADTLLQEETLTGAEIYAAVGST